MRLDLRALPLLLLPPLAAAAAPAAAQAPVSPELQANVYTTLGQRQPSIARAPSGEFVVVWFSEYQDGSVSGLYARLYAPDGTPRSGEIQVSEHTLDHHPFESAVAMMHDGSFVVVWDESVDGAGPLFGGIMGRRFSADGTPLGGDFEVAPSTAGSTLGRPAIATNGGGAFAVVWQSSPFDGEVFLRRFGAGGAPLGPPLQVNRRATFGQQQDPAIAMGPDGELVVVWQSGDVFPGGHEEGNHVIVAQRFAADGARLGGEVHLTASSPRLVATPAVAKDGAGNYIALWADYGAPSTQGLFGRRFAKNGKPLGAVFRLGEPATAEVSMELHGDFVAVWSRETEDRWQDVFAQRYGPDGVPLAPEVRVNTHTAHQQWLPAVARDRDGDFVVAWDSYDQDGSNSGVYARLFAVPELPPPALLRLREGRFQVLATWRVAGSRGDGQAVPLAGDSSGAFWFFDPANLEVIVKIIDGRAYNGYWWVFYGALSSVEYYFTVFDTETGRTRTYFNPRTQLASAGDTTALDPTGEDELLTAAARSPLLAPSPAPRSGIEPGACRGTGEVLCLEQDRFAVEATWRDFADNTGVAHASPLTDDTGTFYFFSAENPELAVKVLDARTLNDHFWVFYGSLTNVEFTLKVTDAETGAVRTYTNPLHHFGSHADTEAF